MTSLPPTFASTRESLRSLACYVIAPARKARTGRIGLRPTGDGFATPVFDDGTSVRVRGDHLLLEPLRSTPITTVRAAAAFAGIDLSDDPGVGRDVPPFAPDTDLAVDSSASFALGAWFAFGQRQLDRLADVPGASEAQIWPEHFDLAVTITFESGGATDVGFSPGDRFDPAPYVYVGPHDKAGLVGDYWNAPFGAVLTHAELTAADDADEVAMRFLDEGLRLLHTRQHPGRTTG